ncbi:MAG: ATP-binding protein [Planctomycetota bacterium]
MRNILREQEVIHQQYHLINWRWIFVAILACVIFAASLKPVGIISNPRPLYIIVIAVILYNLLFKWFLERWKKHYSIVPPVRWLTEGYFWDTAQVLADYVALTFVLYYSGGVENPFFLTYIVHIIASSSLAPRKIVYRYAFAAIALFGGLDILQYYDIIPHHHLNNWLSLDVHSSLLYHIGVLGAFLVLILTITYLATQIGHRLRERESEIITVYEKLLETKELLVGEDKFATVGRMSGMVAHELNTPLAVISGNSELLLLDAKEPELVKQLTTIKEQAARAGRIVQNLSKMSRPSKTELVRISVGSILETVLDFLAHKIQKGNISLIKNFQENTPDIISNPDYLQQVFINIITNAIQAMPQGGVLTVLVHTEGSNLFIKIGDTGIGIDQEDIKQIFEPFFSKREGGTGLGLAIVNHLVAQLKGSIRVNSQVGKGTDFIVSLPITEINR